MEPDRLSKLPDDPAYWAQLQSRVEGAVLAELASTHGAFVARQWYDPLVRRAWWLSGLAAAAAVAVMFVPREATPAASPPMLISASSPTALSPLMSGDAPPAVAELLVSTAQTRSR
jgi:hypothetical protein